MGPVMPPCRRVWESWYTCAKGIGSFCIQLHGIQQTSHPLGAGGPNPTQPPGFYWWLAEGVGLAESAFSEKREVSSTSTSWDKQESSKQLKGRLVLCRQSTATLAAVFWLQSKTSRAPWGGVSATSTSYSAGLHDKVLITEPGLHI